MLVTPWIAIYLLHIVILVVSNWTELFLFRGKTSLLSSQMACSIVETFTHQMVYIPHSFGPLLQPLDPLKCPFMDFTQKIVTVFAITILTRAATEKSWKYYLCAVGINKVNAPILHGFLLHIQSFSYLHRPVKLKYLNQRMLKGEKKLETSKYNPQMYCTIITNFP